MGLETITNGIEDLNKDWPLGVDPKSQGDDHLRAIKAALQLTWPDASGPYNNVQDGAAEDDTSDVHKIWSPLDIAAFIAAYWDAWGLVSQDGISFRAVMEPAQTIPNNQATRMQWILDDAGSPGWDTNGWWDPDNNQYVIGQAGTYQVNSVIGYIDPNSASDTGDPWDSIIQINADQYHIQRTGAPGGDEQFSAPVSAIARLAVDDTISIWSHHQLGQAENFNNTALYSSFEVFRISD